MAYVIEYSAFHYARRERNRNIAVSVVAALVAIATLLYIHVEEASRRPTFRDLVHFGTRARAGQPAAPGLQSSADTVFAIADSWEALAKSHLALEPYLRLRATPATIRQIVAAATTGFTRPDVKPLLVPVSFRVAFEDGPEDWTGLTADRPEKIVATAQWKTRREYLPEEGNAIRRAATNLFSATLPGGASPELLAFEFAGKGEAGEPVSTKFAFPSAAKLPVSKELFETTRRLYALHAEMEQLDLGGGLPSGWRNLVPLKLLLGQKLRAVESEYRRSLDPGAWLAERFPPESGAYGSESNAAAAVFAKWNETLGARLPWQRGRVRRVIAGRNYVNHRALAAFSRALPDATELETARLSLEAGCAALTNAIDAFYFEAFDPSPAARETMHLTGNLLVDAKKTGLFPTNRIASKAVPEQESLVVKFPTRYHASGIRFDDSAFEGASHLQFVFAGWNYGYVATNAPVEIADFAKGFAGFLGAGYGYEPDAVALDFVSDKIAVVRIGGLLPVRQEISKLKVGEW